MSAVHLDVWRFSNQSLMSSQPPPYVYFAALMCKHDYRGWSVQLHFLLRLWFLRSYLSLISASILWWHSQAISFKVFKVIDISTLTIFVVSLARHQWTSLKLPDVSSKLHWSFRLKAEAICNLWCKDLRICIIMDSLRNAKVALASFGWWYWVPQAFELRVHTQQ